MTGHADTPAGRPIVWHVGRRGEVAGGMTQVVNAYLGWTFERFDVRVIVSRDGSTGPRATRLFLAAVRSIFRIGDPARNLVVVHLSQGGSFVREGALLRLARKRGYSVIAHLHGSSFVDFASRRPALVGKVLDAASKVFVLSEATRAAALRFIDTERIAIVPNAVPTGHPGRKLRHVVFGGSVSKRKGVDVLVEAWRSAGENRGWHLDIAGPIADPEVVPEHLADATFHGALPHGRLMELLDAAEVAVLPSRDEAMPMFILEAMARDACVIATNVGGIPSVLGRGAGVLVEAGDVTSLARALDEVMGSDRHRRQLVVEGTRRFAEHYSAAALYPALERLWSDTLESRS